MSWSWKFEKEGQGERGKANSGGLGVDGRRRCRMDELGLWLKSGRIPSLIARVVRACRGNGACMNRAGNMREIIE